MRTEKRLWQTDPFCPTSSTEIHTIFGHPCTTIPTLVLVLRGHWLVGRNIEFYHFVALHLWHLIGQQLFMYVELVFVVFFVCGCRCFTTASWSLTQTERFGMVVMAKMLRDGHSDNGTIQCMFLFFWRNSPYNLLMNVVSICFNKRVTHTIFCWGVANFVPSPSTSADQAVGEPFRMVAPSSRGWTRP